MQGVGPVPARIMIIGRDPGQKEDRYGTPFIGPSGKLLDDLLMIHGFNREEIYITNAVKCGQPGEDKEPGKKEIRFCRELLVKEIEEVKPEIIIVFGGVSLTAVTSRIGILKLQNTVLKCEEFNCKVLPMVHPAFVLRDPGNRKFIEKGFETLQDELSGLNEKKKLGEYYEAKTKDQALQILNKLLDCDVFAIDIETSDLNFLKSEILCISFSWKDKLGAVIPWDLILEGDVSAKFKEVLKSPALKVGHNIKFDIEHLTKKGYPFGGKPFDTMVAHSLIDDNSPENGLDALVLRYTDMGEYWTDLYKFKKEYCKVNNIKDKDFSYKHVPREILHPYAAKDAEATYRLYTLFLEKLHEEEQYDFFINHSMKFLPILIEMEYRGIKINREKVLELKTVQMKEVEELGKQIMMDENVIKYEKYKTKKTIDKTRSKLEVNWKESKTLNTRFPDFEDYYKSRDIESKIDCKFNMSSPIQLSELFFEMMGLKPVKETKKGNASTDKEAMEIIASEYDIPLALMMDTYRKKEKFIEQFLTPIYEKSELDGRIHTNYIQSDIVTGRLSSRAPNLQNLQRDALEFKSCFLSDEGFTFVKGDLSQIEFRVWAAASGDEKMRHAIETGMDIHRKTAAAVFGIEEIDVTADQRNAAKRGTFALMYGVGPKTLAKRFKITIHQAEKLISVFSLTYPIAIGWLNRKVQQAKQDLYVKSLFGRKRRLPHILSNDNMIREKAKRQALNSDIQSMASDLSNKINVLISSKAKKKGINCYPSMTVHDENVFQVKKEQVGEFLNVVEEVIRTDFSEINCRIDYEIKVGDTIGTAKKYEKLV
jgi:DNA polymerase-1